MSFLLSYLFLILEIRGKRKKKTFSYKGTVANALSDSNELSTIAEWFNIKDTYLFMCTFECRFSRRIKNLIITAIEEFGMINTFERDST